MQQFFKEKCGPNWNCGGLWGKVARKDIYCFEKFMFVNIVYDKDNTVWCDDRLQTTVFFSPSDHSATSCDCFSCPDKQKKNW